ncbi:MAG: hypothetical protein MJ074_03285 [Oscillospiraceae bacterium]|nr:hypothetical protein [Oscillospiraceae bacterium]
MEEWIVNGQQISKQDLEVLRLIRELGYGHLVITVKNGQAVHAELQKSVQLAAPLRDKA